MDDLPLSTSAKCGYRNDWSMITDVKRQSLNMGKGVILVDYLGKALELSGLNSD